jgi:hypothetical protein
LEDERLDEEVVRRPVRRRGEVLVVTYTSMITGRITGLRWVIS